MASSSRSLLDFLDAPVVVGDPEGRAVYVNPAFERAFETTAASATGVPLASLFGGGGREAVLSAVASVCGGEGTARFRMREGAVGYAALASPIMAESDRVGVVVLLTEEYAGDDRLLGFHREVQEPLDELDRSLGELAEQGGGQSPAFHRAIDDGVRALERVRKEIEGLHGLLAGRSISR